MGPKLIVAFVLICNVLCAQSSCEIWQWTGTDSANKILSKVDTYNEKGLRIYEKHINFMHDPHVYGAADFTYIHQYDDTLLTTWTIADPDGDSMRIKYQYDSAGRCIRERMFRRKYLTPDTVQSGMFSVTRISLDSTEGKWMPNGEASMQYDRWGRRIFVERMSADGSWKTAFRYEYDDQGRWRKIDQFQNGRKRNTSTYEQFAGGYTYTIFWYNDKGKLVRKLGRKNPPYMQPQVITTKLNARGQMTEEKITDLNGKLIELVVTSYNTQGKIAREVWYDGEGKIALTHVYNYK